MKHKRKEKGKGKTSGGGVTPRKEKKQKANKERGKEPRKTQKAIVLPFSSNCLFDRISRGEISSSSLKDYITPLPPPPPPPILPITPPNTSFSLFLSPLTVVHITSLPLIIILYHERAIKTRALLFLLPSLLLPIPTAPPALLIIGLSLSLPLAPDRHFQRSVPPDFLYKQSFSYGGTRAS